MHDMCANLRYKASPENKYDKKPPHATTIQ